MGAAHGVAAAEVRPAATKVSAAPATTVAATATTVAATATATPTATAVLGIGQNRRSRYRKSEQHCCGGPYDMTRSRCIHVSPRSRRTPCGKASPAQ